MSDIEQQAANVRPPYKGTILVAAATTTTATIDLSTVANDPLTGERAELLRGRYITLQADGGDIYFAIGADSNAISPSAAAGDFSASNCIKIPQDQRIDLFVPQGPQSTLCYVTATGTATLRIWPSSDRNQSR